MSPWKAKFDKEELTLTLTGLGGGWAFRDLGTLRLFDQAQVQFPSSWDKFQIEVATRVIDTQWQLNAEFVLQSTLEAGISYTRSDGVGSSLESNTELIQHILARPTVNLDATFNFKLQGEASKDGYDGSLFVGVSLKARF